MYRNVYFPGIQRRPVNQQQNDYMQNPILRREYPQFNEFSPQVNSAIIAYAAPVLQKPYEKMSLNEALKTLRRQGKIEGRDYEIQGSKKDKIILIVKNKASKVSKILHFDNGNIEKAANYEIYQYQNGKKFKSTMYNADDDTEFFVNYYYNDETPQVALTKEHLTYNTTPAEYLEYLNRNNIKYQIDENIDGENKITVITELYNDNLLNQKTVWTKNLNNPNIPQFVRRTVYGKDKQEWQRIDFWQDKTEVCTYIEKHKSQTYPIATTPQESFTKEHITAYTKPDEYIKYLESNNIRYKIEPQQYGDGRKTILITEYNNYGRETQFTGFELNGENRVLHEIYYPDNSRKRYEFDEEGTYISTYSY